MKPNRLPDFKYKERDEGGRHHRLYFWFHEAIVYDANSNTYNYFIIKENTLYHKLGLIYAYKIQKAYEYWCKKTEKEIERILLGDECEQTSSI